MINSKSKLYIYLLLMVVLLTICQKPTSAQGISQDTSLLISLRDASALNNITSLTIFLSGSDEYYIPVLQDALTIELRKLKWNVKSRIEVETAVREDFTELMNSLPDSVINYPQKYVSWRASLTQSQREKLLDESRGDDASIAKLVNADAYIVGTLLVGRHQYVNNDKNFSASSEKIVITTVSFQIINSARRTPILEAVMSYQNGKSATYVAEDIRKVIENTVKKNN